jgi:N-acylglucosamine-6-phosphate 2-epimerase
MSANQFSPPVPFLAQLRHRLIVSCQAREGEPLRDPAIIAALAQAAVMGGAQAIRANGPDDIRAIRRVVDVPVFGIFKRHYPDSPVYITPTLDEARQIVAAGCHVLTVEATDQPRPGGQTLDGFFQAIQAEFDVPLMADISTVAEGIRAAELGAYLVATTLAGYTPYSRQQSGPDFDLIRELAATVNVPIIAEGRIATPEQARRALELGAFAVVVGSMITRPNHITAYFVRGMSAPAPDNE